MTSLLTNNRNSNEPTQSWVRGVNLGGWLVMERYIVPYQFSITDCHVKGDFCWFPGQMSAPSPNDPAYKLCSSECKPVRVMNSYGNMDYPVDEKTLAEAFRVANNHTDLSKQQVRDITEEWFNYHFETFIQINDLQALKVAGVTHLRVPLPHWIMGDILPDEPWIAGKRWESFVRVCKWARELGLQVWPDVHTAPGSQNGFDNSGQALPYTTCRVWSDNPVYVNRSLKAIREITQAVVQAGIQDVVTGFGLLNEPFADCSQDKYKAFIEDGLKIVHETLGKDTAVYVSDMFEEIEFNDGNWWLDPKKYNNTYLDSHYYQVFDENTRALSPRQHVAFTCQKQMRRRTACCFEDPPMNTKSSQGVRRMVGEWSASYDILPAARITEIMDGIAETGKAPYFDRELSEERKDFLRDFVEAQMVTWEAEDVDSRGSAWFYWTAKIEGGAFAEWSFLRGIEDGWFPTIPDPEISSESLYGSCYDIIFRSDDNMTVVDEFPERNGPPDGKVYIDDDVVLSHGQSLLDGGNYHFGPIGDTVRFFAHYWMLLVVALGGLIAFRLFKSRKRSKYSRLTDGGESIDV